jgi:hypothetical protein
MQSTGRVRGDDSAGLVNRVRARLHQRRLPSFGKVDIAASNGTVHIAGHVPSETEKEMVVDEARRVPGVMRVIADLTISTTNRVSTERFVEDYAEGVRRWLTNRWVHVAAAGLVAFGSGWFVRGLFVPAPNATAPIARTSASRPGAPVAQVAAVDPAQAQAPAAAASAQIAAPAIQPVPAAPAIPLIPIEPLPAVIPAATDAAPAVAVGLPSNDEELIGQVIVDGEYAQGAMLSLVPLEEGAGEAFFIIVKNDDGSFAIPRKKLLESPLEYAVTVQWFPMVGSGEDAHAGPNAVPGKYSKPKTTPLRISLQANAEGLAPFNIE